MGASACFHLASRNLKVLGLEQFDIPHSRGSSHGYSRMIRKAYYEHPDYVELVLRAYELWDDLEAVSQRKLLYRVGGLFMGPSGGTLVGGARLAAETHGLQHEIVSHKQIQSRWPQFRVPHDWEALFEPDAGFLLPERSISTYAEFALRRGADIHAHEPVRQWEATANGVKVATDRGEYEAGHLVFSGGSWSGKLQRDLKIPLKVTRQVAGWVWPLVPEKFELGKFPVWGIDSLDGGMYYGFPMHSDAPGFKLAHHLPGDAIDPDLAVPAPGPEDERVIRRILNEHLPDANGSLLAMRTCMYTNTPDQHFVIDHHPQSERVQIACGFSGHGFKFASAIGEILADQITTPSKRHAIQNFRLDRFA